MKLSRVMNMTGMILYTTKLLYQLKVAYSPRIRPWVAPFLELSSVSLDYTKTAPAYNRS